MTEKTYDRTCRFCGTGFKSVSPWRGICDECRVKRKRAWYKKRNKKTASVGMAEILTPKRNKRDNLDVLIEKARKRKLIIKRTDIDCYNYDPTRVDCACCEAGAWRFKACGDHK